MQDGVSGETNPGYDVLLGITRELGEHAAKIRAAEGQIKTAVVEVQAASREMQFVTSGMPTPESCERAHEGVADKVVAKLTPIIAANGNGTTTAPPPVKRSIWPKDFLGWSKIVGWVVAIGVGLIMFGGWLTDKGLLPGHEGHADGVEVTAHPEDPLRDDLRRLIDYLERGSNGATSDSSDPDWHRMGLDEAASAAETGESG